MLAASKDSESVPIWLIFKRSAFAAPMSTPFESLSMFVTKRSSPTMIVSHSSFVRAPKSSKASSKNGSSIERIG